MSRSRRSPNPNTASIVSGVVNYILSEATFYRVHLAAFILIPLVFSCIFYGSNGRFHVSFLDSLFVCYSAMTVTGLSTVNLSTVTIWQQVILYLLMMMGDITVVSWAMVLVRKHYFRTKCEYVARRFMPKRRGALFSRTPTGHINAISSPVNVFLQRGHLKLGTEKAESPSQQPQFIVTNPTPNPTKRIDTEDFQVQLLDGTLSDNSNPILAEGNNRIFTSSPKTTTISLPPTSPVLHETEFPRTTSFASAHINRLPPIREEARIPYRRMTLLSHPSKVNLPSTRNEMVHPDSSKYRMFGGFPGPLTVLQKVARRAIPKIYRKLERKMTLPYTTTLSGYGTVTAAGPPPASEERVVSWLDFPGLVVGRNSDFHTESLTDEQLEKIGGAEYQALRWLSYIVPLYFILTQMSAYIFFAPWLSTTTQYDPVFEAQPRLVAKPWFSLFQVMGAYTGGGLSLVDMSMIPFQRAYLMIFALMFVILAGNHALPIFLRLIIWIGYKFTSGPNKPGGTASDAHMAFEFLLDHPRRCYVYMFPSHQTWFLIICLVGFSMIEWIGFEVLNIGLPSYESIPLGPRIVDGLFQGLAARASGLAIVPIANFAPSIQFLYVVMMYIAVYPVAMSIRATNVYEERSLGVFAAPPDDDDEEPDLRRLGRRERVGRYVGWHLRRQMSIDIWWLVCAIFIVAIIERHNLLDEDKKWFDLFHVLFELVSAFGGIGLSLGFPTDNFSFAGAMRPLSKVVIIIVMVRGRHRGLPVAIDRAVLLPRELELHTRDPTNAQSLAADQPDTPDTNTNEAELAV